MAASVGLLSASVSAQSFNLDVGRDDVLFEVASSSYGAGANQSGEWNPVVPSAFSATLNDLLGNPTAATVSSDVSNDIGMFPFQLIGDDSNLLEDAQWIPNTFPPATIVEATWTFTGLQDGDYSVYTYAWSADPQILTDVTIGGMTQTVGGSWPGFHQQGVTFALHNVTVSGGSLVVTATGQPGESARVNGFQLVLDDGSGIITNNYCQANPNSTGSAAVISAAGSSVLALNNVTLTASGLPLNKFGYFLASRTAAFIMNPGGSQGNLCLAQPLGRFAAQIQNSGATGQISIPVDVTNVPLLGPIISGETWRFQAWYRDTNPTSTSNFTDGIEIDFM